MPGIDVEQIKRDVVGKWAGIISELTLPIRKDGKHQPCPFCGGKDRFRFDDKDGNGTYICNQCGAGDGWKLVQKSLNIDFMDAVQYVAGIIGSIPSVERKALPNPKKRLNELWQLSTPITGSDPVSMYLHGRGLVLTPSNIRYCPACFEPDSGNKCEAMIARVQSVSGKPISIHRTYIRNGKKADIESPKKLMPGTEKLHGAAIRLFAPKNDTVGVAEGIETAIACTQLWDIPTWATIGTSILETFEPPEGVRKVVVFGDNDANFAGHKSAYILANKLYVKDFIVEVQFPLVIGDFNDVLKSKTAD